MSKTFSQLGVPFPLFEAPTDQASEYCGLGTCSLCHGTGLHCFRLEIGCAVMCACPKCGVLNGLDACNRSACLCRKCSNAISFPDIGDAGMIVCHACLRSGKAAMTKDTELGMISWEQACEGVTHGIPGLRRTDFEMVPKEHGWVGARLPQEQMFELLQTPGYNTIQGEQWLFCCREPMVFVGEWSRQEFSRRSPDGDGPAFFEKIVEGWVPGLWEDQLHDETGIYVFRCRSCNRIRAHWDIA